MGVPQKPVAPIPLALNQAAPAIEPLKVRSSPEAIRTYVFFAPENGLIWVTPMA